MQNKTIKIIIAAFVIFFATVAGALAVSLPTTFTYNYYGSSAIPFSSDGVMTFGVSQAGVGQYGAVYDNGDVFGGYTTTTSSASFGYGATSYNQNGMGTDYALRSLSINNDALRVGIYRTPSIYGQGQYAGSVGIGSANVQGMAANAYYGVTYPSAYGTGKYGSSPYGTPYNYNAYSNSLISNW